MRPKGRPPGSSKGFGPFFVLRSQPSLVGVCSSLHTSPIPDSRFRRNNPSEPFILLDLYHDDPPVRSLPRVSSTSPPVSYFLKDLNSLLSMEGKITSRTRRRHLPSSTVDGATKRPVRPEFPFVLIKVHPVRKGGWGRIRENPHRPHTLSGKLGVSTLTEN